ncbi:MAG: hypothetical protein KDN18_06510 [Verrucomicrobiae bacterium]|nr:hypothetical protein [Verrucomicrobiae bacterium]
MNEYKDAFLDKYNPTRTQAKAVSRGIAASLQHNSLYRRGLALETKEAVKSEWRSYLNGLVDRYKKEQRVEDYERDIEKLKQIMNDKFSAAFFSKPHERFNTDPGFRISHAQKSISVFLKHLWCMGDIACPPQCPVDAMILKKAGKRYPDTKWGYVNSIDEHRLKVSFLEAAKNESTESLAEWELKKFAS